MSREAKIRSLRWSFWTAIILEVAALIAMYLVVKENRPYHYVGGAESLQLLFILLPYLSLGALRRKVPLRVKVPLLTVTALAALKNILTLVHQSGHLTLSAVTIFYILLFTAVVMIVSSVWGLMELRRL